MSFLDQRVDGKFFSSKELKANYIVSITISRGIPISIKRNGFGNEMNWMTAKRVKCVYFTSFFFGKKSSLILIFGGII